jgi:hypothetical protein
VGEDVRERVKLKTDSDGFEWPVRQPGTIESVLAFFDPLFRFATLIAERHQPDLGAYTDRRPLTG